MIFGAHFLLYSPKADADRAFLREALGFGFSKVEEAPWGILTSFALPSGAKVGLYQPKHPTAFKR